MVVDSEFGSFSWLPYDTLLARGWNGVVIYFETITFKDKLYWRLRGLNLSLSVSVVEYKYKCGGQGWDTLRARLKKYHKKNRLNLTSAHLCFFQFPGKINGFYCLCQIELIIFTLYKDLSLISHFIGEISLSLSVSLFLPFLGNLRY